MKYLLEIHHGIGDIVQYTGLIKSVKEFDPNAFIGLVLNKDAYKSLLKFDTKIDDIYIIDFSGDKRKLIKNILKIRKQKYDYMVCSIHSRQKSMEVMAVFFGAKKVVGNKLNRLECLSKRFKNVSVNPLEHVVKQNYDVLKGLGNEYKAYEPYLIFPEAEIKFANKSIGLCIGTSIPQKTWNMDCFITVGEYFSKKGYSIVLLGGEKEKKRYENSGYVNKEWINLLGKMDLTGSASECSECELIIGGDTGLMHMAAAVGTKTLTLFSCSEPLTHAPYSKKSYYYYIPMKCQFCFGTEKMKNCKNYKCIDGIKPHMVIKIAESILDKSECAEKFKLM